MVLISCILEIRRKKGQSEGRNIAKVEKERVSTRSNCFNRTRTEYSILCMGVLLILIIHDTVYNTITVTKEKDSATFTMEIVLERDGVKGQSTILSIIHDITESIKERKRKGKERKMQTCCYDICDINKGDIT